MSGSWVIVLMRKGGHGRSLCIKPKYLPHFMEGRYNKQYLLEPVFFGIVSVDAPQPMIQWLTSAPPESHKQDIMVFHQDHQ